MVQKTKPNGPLTGWIEAGTELIAEQLSGITQHINQQLDAQKSTFDELQKKGAEWDAKLKASLSPSAVFSNVEQSVKANPLWAFMPTFTHKRETRARQLDALSVKVDLLVEQVALLAAKQAKEKAQEAVKASKDSKTKTESPTATVDSAKSIATPEKPTRRPATRKKTVSASPRGRARAVSSVKQSRGK